jgi:hypothetical protein
MRWWCERACVCVCARALGWRRVQLLLGCGSPRKRMERLCREVQLGDDKHLRVLVRYHCVPPHLLLRLQAGVARATD